MPSSKDYKRDYAQEKSTSDARGGAVTNAERTKLRRAAIKTGTVARGDGKDLDHIKPLSKGGANSLANARAVTPAENRSFSRNPDGSLKSQVSRKERGKP